MIYQCQDTFLSLARIVAVSAVKQDRMSGTAEAVFTVSMSGTTHAMYFRAYERSAKATVILRDEHHKLLTEWHRYRASKNLGLPSIYNFGNLQLNLLAISAVSELETHKIGLGGGGRNPAITDGYYIYVMGLNEPIKRRLHESGHDTADQLALERELLIDAWKSFERLEPANQKAI